MQREDVRKEMLVEVTQLLPDFRTIDLELPLYRARRVGQTGMVKYPVNATLNNRWVVYHTNGSYGIYHHDELHSVAAPLLHFAESDYDDALQGYDAYDSVPEM